MKGQAAVAVVNLVYLPMSVLSGLWMPLFVFPPMLQKLAALWPAWHLGQMALGVVGQVEGVRYGLHAGVLLGDDCCCSCPWPRCGCARAEAAMKLLHGVIAASVLALAAMMYTLVPATPANNGKPAKIEDKAEFVVRDVRVFDGEKTWPRASVHVRDGLIVAIGETLVVPKDAQVIEGAGRTLLPGLIDAHVHTWGDARRDALRFGVTTELDMFSDPSAVGGRHDASAPRWPPPTVPTCGPPARWPRRRAATAPQYGMAIPTLSAPGEAIAWVAGAQGRRLGLHQDRARGPARVPRQARHADAGRRHGRGGDRGGACAGPAGGGARLGAGGGARVAARRRRRPGARVPGCAGRRRFRGAGPRARRLRGADADGGGGLLPANSRRSADDPRVAPWLSADQRQTLGRRMPDSQGANPALLAQRARKRAPPACRRRADPRRHRRAESQHGARRVPARGNRAGWRVPA